MAIIQSTTDYDQFNVIQGNRVVNRGHVEKLKKSIVKNNLLEDVPILVNKQLEVIDGQHRLTAARELGLPIFYRIGLAKSIQDVQILNTASRNWTSPDYLESYVLAGVPSYVELKTYMNKHQLPLSLSISYLNGVDRNNKTIRSGFKEGMFIVVDRPFADEMAARVTSIRKYCEETTWKDRDFLNSLAIMWEHMDHAEILDMLGLWGKKITRRGNKVDYLREFEDIYRDVYKKQRRFY